MDSVEIRVWMLRNGITSKGISEELGVTRTAVSNFIAGIMTSNNVRRHFIKKGCPLDILPIEKPTRGRKTIR
jgi:hypothetical protein